MSYLDKCKTIYDYALAYASLGFKTLPCHTLEDNVCSCGKTDCRDIAKHPLTEHGAKDATADGKTLKRFFTGDYETANIAVATGEPSGVWVLDVDDIASLTALEAKHGALPQTWSVETGSGKRHYYFRFDDACESLKNATKFAGSLDVRTTGGYVLLPPSLHASGKRYRWLLSPDDCEIANAPDWLLALIPKHGAKTHRVERAHTLYERALLYLASCPPAISGANGHSVTFATVCRLVELFGGGLTDSELLDALATWNERCEPPWSEDELRHKLRDARAKVTHHAPNDLDDDDVCETFSDDTFPVLADDALHGIVGDIVRTIEPETEADNAGVLVSLLCAIGNVIGKRPYFRVGSETHHVNLFACLVGDTASGKGMAWSIAHRLLKRVAPDWTDTCIAYGLSSGEGLIERVADNEATTATGTILVPPTQRLLCYESEFAKPITAMRREGNTLSAILRSAWDGQTLEVMTRSKSKLRASNAFVSVVAHVTPDELADLLKKGTETTNVACPRFLVQGYESAG